MNTGQLNFAYKLRHALNENLDSMPEPALERLAAARKLALSRKKSGGLRLFAWRPQLAASGQRNTASLPWLGAAGALLPTLALLAGLAGIFQAVEQRRIADTAAIDAEMLADELPLSAYLDNGFNAFLAERGD